MNDPYDDDPVNEYEEDDGYIAPSDARRCVECEYPTIGEQCGFCGNDLCPACFEMGGGFCSKPHTQEQIDAYEDYFMGRPSPEKIRQRQARDELRAMGILPLF